MAMESVTQGRGDDQLTLKEILQRYCQGKTADDVVFTVAENIDVFLNVAEVMYHGGEEADRLRDLVRGLKIDLALRQEG